jgi:hypothetical protein
MKIYTTVIEKPFSKNILYRIRRSIPIKRNKGI